MKQDNTKYIIYGGGLLLIYFGVLRPILNKFGVTKGPEAKKVENAETEPAQTNPFKPDYYKSQPIYKVGGWLMYNDKGLAKFTAIIENAFGFFNDDEDKIFGVFGSLGSKMQVSQLAEYIAKTKGMDIINFLRRGASYTAGAGLNDTEIAKIVDIVNSKPVYTK